MIEYIEVRDSTFTLTGVVDIVQSVIWKTEYYGCGEFEIFAKLTPASRELLKKAIMFQSLRTIKQASSKA